MALGAVDAENVARRIGFALGIILHFLMRRTIVARDPRPHPYAAISIIIAIIIEAIAFRIIMPRVRPLGDRQTGLTTLAIVSLHFLIMIPAFGPVIALLTALGLINVWLGWKRSDLRLNRIWLIDGVLKIAFGIAMVATAPVIG